MADRLRGDLDCIADCGREAEMKEIYFTKYDDGLLRRIEIEKDELEGRPGWAYARSRGFQWKFRGHRGWYETQYKAVPYSAIIIVEVDDEIKDESAPIPVSALSTFKLENLSDAIVADIRSTK